MEAFARAYFDPKGKQADLQAYIAPAVDRFRLRGAEAEDDHDRAALDALEIFRKDLRSFVRAYEFLAQIFPYDDTDLEQMYVYARHLLPWLKRDRAAVHLDLSAVELTHYRLQDLGKRQLALKEAAKDGDGYKLPPMGELGTGAAQDPHMATLEALIRQMNDLFSGDLSDADLVTYARHISGKLLENEVLARQAATNTKEQFALGDFSGAFIDTVVGGLDSYQSMAEQVLTSDATRQGFERLVLDLVYQGFAQLRSGERS